RRRGGPFSGNQRRTWGERFQQFAAGTPGGAFDEFDNFFDPFRHGGGFQIKKMRTGHGHMRHSAIDFEKLQAAGGKLLAKHRGDLEWEPLLIFPGGANQPGQAWGAEVSSGNPAETERIHLTDSVWQMSGSEMRF